MQHRYENHDSTHSDTVGGGINMFPLVYKRDTDEEEEAEELDNSY